MTKKPIPIAILGSQNSGKTTTIEALTKELTKRGYRVAAVKHIPEPDFTMDTTGKDTWRFGQSGAQTVMSIAAHEIATLEKTGTKSISLREILRRCKGNDVVFIEGFRKLVSNNKRICKIVAVKSAEEAEEAMKNFRGILAFSGPYSTESMNLKIPYINVLRNPEKIADVAEKVLR
jgi:molybdopterin-guanine dinucleotide biosynthesis protein B